jgi:hypothetical protein
VTDMESWQRIFQLASVHSRWDLPDPQVSAYLTRAFDYIVDLYHRMEGSEPWAYDPSGDLRLRLAKRLRRETLRREGEPALEREADRQFGMPVTALRFSEQVAPPLRLEVTGR